MATTIALETGQFSAVRLNVASSISRQRASVTRTAISGLVGAILKCPAAQRRAIRNQIVRQLEVTKYPDPAIDELVHNCITRGGPDGLDIAIDVLAETKSLIVDYAWKFICHDVQTWTPASERAYQPNDEYWYVLLRAVARTSEIDEQQKLLFLSCCSNAESRSIREGVIDALRDIGTATAIAKLKQIVVEDQDSFIVQIAAEALAELEN